LRGDQRLVGNVAECSVANQFLPRNRFSTGIEICGVEVASCAALNGTRSNSKEQKEEDKKKEKANPHPPFSQRQLVKCFQVGATHFGWDKRNPKPGSVREGRWLVGIGVQRFNFGFSGIVH
jgi:hypothetical protein